MFCPPRFKVCKWAREGRSEPPEMAMWPMTSRPLQGPRMALIRFSAIPGSSSSEPCRYFQRGFCWASKPFNPHPKSSAPFNPNRKAPCKKERAPEVCLDWYLTGTCPRLRTCRYAHPRNVSLSSLKDEEVLGNRKTSGKGYDDFGFLGRGSFDVDDNDEMGICGFTDDDVYELSLQGIRPWDPEAGAALAVLNGWDMDDGFGYGYGDYGYY
ncbi:hypothetical protein L7F22_060198 [Adiantum nelumboides]|nr:hypothetical protein [Adiantum nelumboides]